MKSLLLIFFILVAIIAVAFWKGSAVRTRASYSMLPFGVVDSPRPREALRGHATLRGWALSESEIESVAVYLDRTLAGFATLGVSRPDVRKAFPAFPRAAEAGWQLDFDVTGMKSGPHELEIQARSRQGATRDLGDVAVTVVY
jgi:hypothetical protein